MKGHQKILLLFYSLIITILIIYNWSNILDLFKRYSNYLDLLYQEESKEMYYIYKYIWILIPFLLDLFLALYEKTLPFYLVGFDAIDFERYFTQSTKYRYESIPTFKECFNIKWHLIADYYLVVKIVLLIIGLCNIFRWCGMFLQVIYVSVYILSKYFLLLRSTFFNYLDTKF